MVLVMFTLIILVYPSKIIPAVQGEQNGSTVASLAFDSEAFFRNIQHQENNIAGLEECKEDPIACFVVVVENFLLGEWESDSHLVNIVYGLILLLVLTNVVIAIISDAWGQSADTASSLFWRSRLKFLSELTVLDNIGKSNAWTMFHRVLKKIDNVTIPKVVDRTSWSNTLPYCLVTKQKGKPRIYWKH